MPGPHLLLPHQPWGLQGPFLAALRSWATRNLPAATPLNKALLPFATTVHTSRATIARLVTTKGVVPTPMAEFRDRLALELNVDPLTFSPIPLAGDHPTYSPVSAQPFLAEIEGEVKAPPKGAPVPGMRYPLIREPGWLEVISVHEPSKVVRYRRVGGDPTEFESPYARFWQAVEPSTQASSDPHPNRHVIPNTEGLALEDTQAASEATVPVVKCLRISRLGSAGAEIALRMVREYRLWPEPEDVILPVSVAHQERGGHAYVHIPGGPGGPVTLVVPATHVARAEAGHLGANPAIELIHTALSRMKAQRDEAIHTASVGITQVQDPLLPLRDVAMGLNHLNDDLKILVVDTQDVSEDSKDPRNAHIAKRIATLRKTLQGILKKLGPNA